MIPRQAGSIELRKIILKVYIKGTEMAQPDPCEYFGNCVTPPTLMDKLENLLVNPLTISVIIVALLIAVAILKPKSKVADVVKFCRNWSQKNITVIALVVGLIMIMLPIMMPNFIMLQASVENEFGYWTAVSASRFLGIRFGVIICMGCIITIVAAYKILKRKY